MVQLLGTIFAPTYADLTMGYFEVKFYNLCNEKWGEIVKNFIYENWKRYLDDCQIPNDTTLVNPKDLLELLNSINT